jgi:hypothetical protein
MGEESKILKRAKIGELVEEKETSNNITPHEAGARTSLDGMKARPEFTLTMSVPVFDSRAAR